MYYDKSNSIIRTFTKSDIILKSGHENPTPRVDSYMNKTRYSRISQELRDIKNMEEPLKEFDNENYEKTNKEDILEL